MSPSGCLVLLKPSDLLMLAEPLSSRPGVPGAMQAWTDFCTDCVLLVCARHVATGKGIPIMKPPSGLVVVGERADGDAEEKSH